MIERGRTGLDEIEIGQRQDRTGPNRTRKREQSKGIGQDRTEQDKIEKNRTGAITSGGFLVFLMYLSVAILNSTATSLYTFRVTNCVLSLLT